MENETITTIELCAGLADREAARLRELADAYTEKEQQGAKTRFLAGAITADRIARDIRELLPKPKSHATPETKEERAWRLGCVFRRLNYRLRSEGRDDPESVRLERCAMTAAIIASYQAAGVSAEIIEREIEGL